MRVNKIKEGIEIYVLRLMNSKIKTEVTTWKECRETVAKLNLDIVNIIDNLSGSAKYRLLKVRYPYTAPIQSNGVFNLNIDGEIIPHTDSKVPGEIQKLLDYPFVGMPLGLTLQGTIEVHTWTASHSVPLNMISPGIVYSLVSVLDYAKPSHLLRSAFSLKSGCESILLLPAISDKIRNEALQKKYSLTLPDPLPKTFADQRELIQSLSTIPLISKQWQTETLIFTSDFFKSEKIAKQFKDELTLAAWPRTAYPRYLYLYEVVWFTFMEKAVHKEMASIYKRSAFHIIPTVKHLVDIAMGQACGFIPATDDTTAPISNLIDLYIDDYNIRSFHPTIMTVGLMRSLGPCPPVYYSMHRHTFLNVEPDSSQNRQTINELILVREILLKFQEFILSHRKELGFDLSDTILFEAMQNTQFDFYHPQADEVGIKNDINSLFDEDIRFDKVHRVKSEPSLQRPLKSSFFKGAIRITRKGA